RSLRERFGLATESLDTIVLVGEGRAYLRSAAALRILRGLGLPWSLLYVLVAIPRPLRDAAYDWFARNRYRWFGTREECRLPEPWEKERFLA
ncbi:MAG: thiol-disulfide oxidoreductase DCC family protein, partial [Candidatus Binatia bacterium]